MKPRLLELLLLPVLLLGGVLAWQSGRERSRLAARYDRLSRVAGELPIADPSKLYVQAIPTGEPLHFAWRVYAPANYRLIVRDRSGGESSSMSNNPNEFIARARIREEEGVLYAYWRIAGGSSKTSFGDLSLVKFLRENGSAVRVAQLGSDGCNVIEPTQSATLLRLTLPDDAKKSLSPYAQTFVPVLFDLELGPKAPTP